MPTRRNEKSPTVVKAEAFVREALSKSSKKPPSERTVRSVAKKVAKALPQHVAHA
jgi:hypothetical protein